MMLNLLSMGMSESSSKVSKPASGHRYWRLNILNTQNGSYINIAEINFREVLDTPGNMTGTTTAFDQFSGYPPSNAVDGTANNVWAAPAASGWWQIDYGGSPKDIIQVQLSVECPNAGGYSYMPANFQLQYSDNGTDFTTVKAWSASSWSACEVRTFNV